MFLRRFAIASTVLLVGAVLTAPAMADQVNIDGDVASSSSVVSTPTSGVGLADDLDLGGEGTATADVVVKVADMALTTNNTEGVTLTATAAGDLDISGGGSTPLTYNVKIVGDEAAQPLAADFTGTSDSVTVNDFVSGASARDLYIEYDAPALLDPGNYISHITVTVLDI